jgi:hypothetical protein
VDNVVRAFVQLIENDAVGLWQVGRKAHTVYDLAIETRDVVPMATIAGCPRNVTMKLDVCLP